MKLLASVQTTFQSCHCDIFDKSPLTKLWAHSGRQHSRVARDSADFKELQLRVLVEIRIFDSFSSVNPEELEIAEVVLTLVTMAAVADIEGSALGQPQAHVAL